MTMQVSLTEEDEAIVRSRIASGHNYDASEVVAEALRLLHDRDHERELLLAALVAGEESAARDGVIEWSPSYMARLTEEVRATVERRRTVEPTRRA